MVKQNKFSLNIFLIIFLLVTATFPLAVVGYTAINSIAQERMNYSQAMIDKQTNQLENYQDRVDEVLKRISTESSVISYLLGEPTFPFEDDQKVPENIKNLVRLYDTLQGIHSVDIVSATELVYSTQESNQYDIALIKTWLQTVPSTEAQPVFVGMTKIDARSTDQTMVTSYLPVYNKDEIKTSSSIIGFIAIHYNFNEVFGGGPPLSNPLPAGDGTQIDPTQENRSIFDPMQNDPSDVQSPGKLDENVTSILVDGNKNVISDTSKFMSQLSNIDQISPDSSLESGSFVKKINNQVYSIIFSTLEYPQVTLFHLTPVETLSNYVLPYKNNMVIVLVICLLATLSIGYGVIYLLLRPVYQITHSLKMIQSGTFDWNTRINTSWLREIDELIGLFNSSLDNQLIQKRTELALVNSEQKFRSLFDNSPVPLWEEDFSLLILEIEQLKLSQQGLIEYLTNNPNVAYQLTSKIKILDVNLATLKLFQAADKEDLIGNIQTIFQDTDIVGLCQEILHIVKHQKRYEQIIEHYTVRGKRLTIHLQWSVYPGSEKNMDRVVVSTTDITEQEKVSKLQAAILKISQDTDSVETLQDLYPSIHTTLAGLMPARNFYIARFDEKTGMISFPYFVDEYDSTPPDRLFGHGWTEVVINSGKPVLIPEKMITSMQDDDLDSIGTIPVCWLGVPLIVKEKTIGVVAVQTYDHDTKYTLQDRDLLMIVANQIAEAINEKQTEERLIHTSTHDELTGLYNRAYYEAEIVRLSAGRDEPVGVIMIDIDGLKYINDNHGHAVGDKLITASGEIIRQAFRVNDVVSRIGGDEFAILLPESDSHVVSEAIARLQTLVDQYSNPDLPGRMSLSIGGCTTEGDVRLTDAIIRADQKMYEVKGVKKERANKAVR